MRTKALLCAAALAVSMGAAMAQSNVYSLNVVGYYNITIPANQYVLIANQLNTTNNTLGALIPTPNDGCIFQKYSGTWTAAVYDGLAAAWDTPGLTLNPGEGGFLKDPNGFTLTLVGEVLQGSLVNTLPIGAYAIRSSMVPQAGLITADLKLPAEDDDIMQTYSGGWTAHVYDGLAAAWDSEPNVAVGQAFFYQKSPASLTSTWTRNFTVQ